MTEYSPSSAFEAELRAALNPGRLRPEFASELRVQLRTHAARASSADAPRRRRLRPAWAVSLFIAVLLAITVLVIGPQRVLAQVLSWFGYVPGVGFVETEGGLRVLEQPQSQTQDGVRVDVLDGLIDDKHTILTINFDGIRQDQKPTSEDEPGCLGNPVLRLPDETTLQVVSGEGGGGISWLRMRFIYPALAADVNDAVLEIPCVPETLPGLAPENWELPLHFVPAPADLIVLPVQPVQQPTPTSSLHGFALSVDDYVEMEDGYLLRGRLIWDEDAYAQQPDLWLLDLVFLDAQGERISTEVDSTYASPVEGENYFAWTLQTNTKYITSPARLALNDISVRRLMDFGAANSYEIDLGSQPYDGQVFEVNKTLQLNGYTVLVTQVELKSRLDGTYAVLARISFDPDQITTLNLMDLDNQSQMLWWSGAGALTEGEIEIGIGYDYLPTGLHRFWVDNYFERLWGPWEAAITLPEPVGEAPKPEGACINQDLWLAPLASAGTFDAADRLLVEGGFSEGIYFPRLVLIDLRDAEQTELMPGGWGALSADGEQVAYTDGLGLHVFSVSTLQDRLISTDGSAYSPVWSPSGDELSFIKGADGVWLISSDGSHERRVPNTHPDMIGLAGWMPDDQHLIVITNVPSGSQIQQVDVHTGSVEDLFLIDNHKGGFAVLSPNGEHIAYSGELFGSINYGLYVSRLDGSEQQLVAEPGDRVLFIAGVWSPDGEWLLVNPYDTNALEPGLLHPLAVKPSTCEVIPFKGVSGNAIGWAR